MPKLPRETTPGAQRFMRRAVGRRRPLGRCARHRRGRDGGQILVLAILAITLLVGLVFYVYNLGWQVNRRLSMQNTADAVAASGAVWMARSMNVVAMNNVATARLLALVPVLDALPLATVMSWTETRDWESGLQWQVAELVRGGPVPGPDRQRLLAGLESLRGRLAHQRDILAALNGRMDPDLNGGSFRMADTTYWSVRGAPGPPPHGSLWQAAATLREFSRASFSSAGLLAQADAVRIGEANGARAAFLVPMVPSVPVNEHARFADFRPVLEGSLKVRQVVAGDEVTDEIVATMSPAGGAGGAIPDYVYPYRLGPWARLFPEHDGDPWTLGWRRPIWHGIGGPSSPPEAPQEESGWQIGLPGMGGGVGSAVDRSGGDGDGGDGADGGRRVLIGYTTYGPYRWAISRLSNYAMGGRGPGRRGELADTRWYAYVSGVSRIKLGYMFGPKQLKTHHYPLWITPYADAKAMARTEDVRISYTKYYYVEVLEGGPWPGGVADNTHDPINRDFRGWHSPEKIRDQFIAQVTRAVRRTLEWLYGPPVPVQVDRVSGNHVIWYDRGARNEKVAELTFGQIADYVWKIVVWMRHAYVTSEGRTEPMTGTYYFVFGGIDVGGDVPVRNPCNYDEYDELPAPYLLDTVDGDYVPVADEGWRRERFNVLGVARRGGTAEVWPQKFSSANPIGSIVAIAQAQVFNNKSWDLWTQDWQAQLMPVSRWDDWMDRVQAAIDQAPDTGGLVHPDQVEKMYRYMAALPATLIELYMRH